MNLHICAKFGGNRPSGLVAFPEFVVRLVRLFAAVLADSRKEHVKHVAFSGALAEELMIFCRHVRTELYIGVYIDEDRTGYVCMYVCVIVILLGFFYTPHLVMILLCTK